MSLGKGFRISKQHTKGNVNIFVQLLTLRNQYDISYQFLHINVLKSPNAHSSTFDDLYIESKKILEHAAHDGLPLKGINMCTKD